MKFVNVPILVDNEISSIQYPSEIYHALQRLKYFGYESYIVGGCVRDSIMGITPKDWDICTSATPDQVKDVFKGSRILDTGLKHGTVTLLREGGQYEITTFRIDGNYEDGRHPSYVQFTSSIIEDLSRRDFTMNALAHNPDDAHIVDPFHGVNHILSRRIKCVRNPDERFHEDGLRILRALRFASTYDFKIDGGTSDSIHRNYLLLEKISKERIQSELCKLLMGKGTERILLEYKDVISFVIPELRDCIGFDQNNKYHCYDIYDHIVHAVGNYKGTDLIVKIALLLHDIGKPLVYTEDENGGHFYGHAVPSRDIAEKVLDDLKFDNTTKHDVLELVLFHDSVMEPTAKVVRRWLNKVGEDQYRRLLDIRLADIQAHAPDTQQSRIDRRNALVQLLDKVISEDQCFSLKDLEIKGRDIIDLGVPQGPRVGEILDQCLDAVITEEIGNNHAMLIDYVRRKLL